MIINIIFDKNNSIIKNEKNNNNKHNDIKYIHIYNT